MSTKKSDLSEEEKKYFNNHMRQTAIQPEINHSEAEENPHDIIPNLDYLQPTEWLSATQLISLFKSKLQPKQEKKFTQGQLPIKATIDLHGMNQNDACQALNHFISHQADGNSQTILIIHGKSDNNNHPGPILRNLTSEILRQHTYVQAYHSAQPKHGGTGATYALLKIKQPKKGKHD